MEVCNFNKEALHTWERKIVYFRGLSFVHSAKLEVFNVLTCSHIKS